MAHYFIFEERLGYPFQGVKEMKTLLPQGVDRRQRTHHPKVLFILDGHCGVKTKGGVSATLNRGDLLIISKPCQHSYTSLVTGQDAEFYTFGVYIEESKPLPKGASPLTKEWEELKRIVFSKDLHIPGGITGRMRTLIDQFREEHDGNRLGKLNCLRSIIAELFVEISRTLSEPPPPPQIPHRSHSFIVNEVKEYLGKTVGRRLTLPSIAFHFKLSEEHLARVFKKETGGSVMGYLRKVRVEAAKTFLLSTTEDISSLGIRIGFSSSNHFCRAFSQLTGQTPMAYRRTHGGLNDPTLPPRKKVVAPSGSR